MTLPRGEGPLRAHVPLISRLRRTSVSMFNACAVNLIEGLEVTKFFIPLIEIIVAFGILYLLPEGIFRLFQRSLGSPRSSVWNFLLENVRGYLFGTAIALTCFFAVGISPEDFFANSVRSTANFIRESLGMDSVAICVRRAKEQFRYDPDTFAEEVSSFNLLEVMTLSPRQALLAEGQKILLFQSPSSRKDLMERAYRSYCQNSR
ncbi:hypothetical protein JMM61_20210 [Rhodovulum sulfidophilum]|uniref:hypothetical protein n=1 Tax=Rhodovulum sulfidophilum TaxID=35806 RepID=UPI001925BD99|nr:hypothetical protein [Rhodovulum sulfidophilum]MBL3587640.1 hypothetical protein [Rhodovulum sulfidophilum]